MLQLVKENVRLAHINNRQEKHGDEEVLAIDLKFDFRTSNAVLLKFSDSLRDALYTKDDGAVVDMINPDHAPKLRNPQMGPVKWALDIPSVRLAMLTDGTNDEEIIFSGAKCGNFSFQCQEGGTVIVTFRVQVSGPDEVDVTKLLFMMGKMVRVNLDIEEIEIEVSEDTRHPEPDLLSGRVVEGDDEESPEIAPEQPVKKTMSLE